MRERSSVIQIRLTEVEKKKILRDAKRCKLSASAYLRELAKGYTPQEYPAELHWLCFEVELLMEDFTDHKDGKFREFLSSFLEDIRSVLYPNGGDE